MTAQGSPSEEYSERKQEKPKVSDADVQLLNLRNAEFPSLQAMLVFFSGRHSLKNVSESTPIPEFQH
jgi:hypothetical protein